MSRILLPPNSPHSIVVNNGTAQLPFTFNANGTFSITSSAAGNFKAIINPANITTSDKTFSLPNRTGNIALEDMTSLLAMMPALSNGYFLTNNGSTISWAAIPNGSLTTLNGINCDTYDAQTFGVGTTGTAPNWVSQNSNTNTHVINIPMASASGVTAGLISKTEYDKIPFKDAAHTFNGVITFTPAAVFTAAPTVTTPGTLANNVATLQQVWDARNGIGIRPPVDGIDTTNYTSGLPVTATINGVTAAAGQRYLFTNLTGTMAGYNNKVYKVASIGPVTWVGGTSTPTAELDGQAGTGAPTDGDLIFVRSGDNADQQWAYTGSQWVQYSVSKAFTFSNGLTVDSNNLVTPTYGTAANTFCAGNDSRLSNARTPTAHQLDSATYHTISGKIAGQVLIATAATTFGFVTFGGDVTSVSAAGAVTIGKIGGVAINDLGLKQNSATLADNTSTPTLVTGCSWAIATYRSIKIEYSISRGAGNYVTGYIALLHDGTTPRITVIEDDSIGTHGITFSTDITGGNIRLLFTTTSASAAATMKFFNYTFPI